MLVINVFSGGSIARETWTSLFTLNHFGQDSHVIGALELADVKYEIVRENEHDRATEAQPSADGRILSRVLPVLGAPVGSKADQRLSLPTYLKDAPAEIRETFVYSYLENRAVEHDEKDTLTIRETRNRRYLASLANLIEDVADGHVQLGEEHITISADAARNLDTVR